MIDLKFRVGDLVFVRSPEEILATLDDEGTLGGVPFMPEMLGSIGKSFRIQRRVEKTCVAPKYPVRRFPGNDVVILDGPRCDGEAHDGCRHACRVFWKEAWLRPANAGDPAPRMSEAGIEKLRVRLKTKVDEKHYFCQSTELFKATEAFPAAQRIWGLRIPTLWKLRVPLREIRSGDLSVFEISGMFVRWCWNWLRRAVYGDRLLQGPHKQTPTESLGLKPGELVRVKSRKQILETLSQKASNRGLYICYEMLRCCGREAEVRQRVERIVDEVTGKMQEISNSVTLQNMKGNASICEECLCHGQLGDCPRGEIMYWREIWLERVTRGENEKI